jgi:hypothetical protein
MNFQRVTADAWSYYLLKYAFKCEPAGSLDLDSKVAKSLGLHRLTDTQMRVVSAFCPPKPVSPCEAAMASMEFSIVDRSNSVVTIDSAPPNRRSKIVMPGSASWVLVNPIDKYCARSSSLEDVTFYKYFQYFVLTREEKRSGSLLGMDGFDNLVYARLALDSLVRFSDFHPAHQIEGYFFNVLLQKYPFRFEADLLSPENSSWSYFVECQLHGLINNEANIETHLQSYAERHLIASEQRQQLLNKIMQKHPLQSGEFDPLVGRSRVSARGRATGVDVSSVQDAVGCVSMPASLDSFSLNGEQQRLVQEIQCRPTCLYIIFGLPDCGKSYLLRYLHAWLASKNKNVVLFESIGAAAACLGSGALTAHRRFSIPAKSSSLAPLYPGSFAFDVLLGAPAFLGDEFSMVDCSLLDLIIFRLQQVTKMRNCDDCARISLAGTLDS